MIKLKLLRLRFHDCKLTLILRFLCSCDCCAVYGGCDSGSVTLI